jgi:succinoglycan biosynthesis transport protein ExoP
MDAPLAPSEDKHEVHLLDYWRIVWRGRWTVLSVFVVVATLVAIGTFTQKAIYRGTATVEITPYSHKVSPVADVAQTGTSGYGWYAEERYYNTQYEIIRSRDVAKRVFDRLDLYDHPRFRETSDPVGNFSRLIEVEPVKETGIVEISVESPNPEEAAAWANATAQAYVDRNLDLAVQDTSNAVKALLGEIAPLREKVEDSQRNSFEVAAKSNLYVPENEQKITNDRLSTLQADLTDAQVKRVDTESLLRQIESVRQSGGSYETIPQIGNDPVIQDLYREKVGLEREYEKLLVTFKDKHIRVLEKQSEIDKINQKIASEAQRIIANLQAQQALLRDREQKLARAVDDTRAESMRVSQKATSFDLVRGEAAETKRIYDLISARMKEIDLSSSLLSNNLHVLDKSPVPKVPVKPRKALNLAVGLLLGVMLGVGVVFFLEYMDNTVRTTEDVEQFLGLHVLAVVPKEDERTQSALREAYQTLRTSLLFARKTRSQKIVLITSAGPQEGKSCTTVNLARVLAAGGERTIILDCDLRRPTVHQRLNVARDRGITNYILSSDGDDWRNYAKPTSVPNLYAMTSGPIPPNPADIFGHERFQNLLRDLRQQFDWVFVDSPPIVSLADSLILASVSDVIVFVIKHNENDKEVIRRSVTNLRRVNSNVVGAVLNSVDIGRSHYKDYYYVGYYYYGEGTDRKARRRKNASLLATVDDTESADSVGRSA